jgi:hypothetical protein
MLADVALKRKAKGLKLNYPEAVAVISAAALDGARAGKTIAEVTKEARTALTKADVMDGVAEGERPGEGGGGAAENRFLQGMERERDAVGREGKQGGAKREQGVVGEEGGRRGERRERPGRRHVG